jgi:Uma2 family endonuclease
VTFSRDDGLVREVIMMEAILEKLLSVDEFWELCHSSEYVGRRMELVEGVMVEMSPTGGEHGETTVDLTLLVGNFVKRNKLGRLSGAETAYILYRSPDPDSKDTVRAPDLGFVRLERAPEPFGPGFIPLVPDLVIEVVSPSERVGDIESKLHDYLRFGVRLIWMVYPRSHVMVFSHGVPHRLMMDDVLDGEDVLPGFSLKVSDIFPT